MAPIQPLRDLKVAGMKNNELRKIRDNGGASGLMYLPWPSEDDQVDEWQGHAAALLYRMALVTQGLLDSRTRIARLSGEAQRILTVRLMQVVSPNVFDPDDPGLLAPDMSDSWAAQASETSAQPSETSAG